MKIRYEKSKILTLNGKKTIVASVDISSAVIGLAHRHVILALVDFGGYAPVGRNLLDILPLFTCR